MTDVNQHLDAIEEDNDRRFGADFFAKVDNRTEFLAATLADSILEAGPLAQGIDDRIWAYQGGVWRPAKDVVRNRSADLLGERYRADRANSAADIVRSRIPVIDCSPVSQYINFTNGLLDWKTGALHQHTPDIPTTIQLAAAWNSAATCPEFDAFLAEVVPSDMIPVMWELIGYMMYSGNPLHKAVMFTGHGRNGKGTFLRALSKLLGAANITAVTLQALASERFATASLFGKLANIAGDIDGTYMAETARFKGITGEDSISAEFKNRDAFEFEPYAVPMFSANKVPGSADVTTGYMARWLVVPFPNNFLGREDRTLDARISTQEELQGIAAKAAPALYRLMERGNFEEPDTAKEAMSEFRRKVDQVATWIAEELTVDASLPDASRTELYTSYKFWAHREGMGQLRSSEFYDRLASNGLKAVTVRGSRMFRGVKLNSPAFQHGA